MIKKAVYKKVFFFYSKGSGKDAILILHGLGGTSWSMRRYFSILEKMNVSFIASDHPSHGYTSETDFNRYIEAINEFSVRIGIERYSIISHSFGAFFAETLHKRFKEKINKVMLVTPLLEITKQTKGIGLYFYTHPYFFDIAGNIGSHIPQHYRYPDYAYIGRKPYYAYWLSDMTHCNIKEYFKIQSFVSAKKLIYDDYLKGAEIHLGKYDTITDARLTLDLIKNRGAITKVHNADHLLPLKEFYYFKNYFIDFVKKCNCY